jgi:hypothetical protein
MLALPVMEQFYVLLIASYAGKLGSNTKLGQKEKKLVFHTHRSACEDVGIYD